MSSIPMEVDMDNGDMDIDMSSEDELVPFTGEMDELDELFDIGTITQWRHILLPRYLPHGNYDLPEVGAGLLNKIVDVVESLVNYLPPKTVELMTKLKHIHTNCTPQTVMEEINTLRPGDSLAMFVQKQDCAIMFRIPTTENWNDVQNVIVATFVGSLHSSELYECDDDIEYNYPERAVRVKLSPILRSQEFASQLCALNENAPPEIEKDCVSKWLISLLMDGESRIATAQEFPVITKKIRDEALCGDDQAIYFRRSSFYMCIKAILQHSLTLKRGPTTGKLLYKIVMLKFLVDTCEPWTEFEKFNIELLSHMIGKLARRIEKLLALETDDTHINAIRKRVVDEAKEIIKQIRKIIDGQIKNKFNDKNTRLKRLLRLDFERDIKFEMTKLNKYLGKRGENQIVTEQAGSESSEVQTVNESCKRHFKNGLPKIKVVKALTDALELRIFWADFENTILYDMKLDDNHPKAKRMRAWSVAYSEYAEHSYKTNKLSMSRMLLVRLKIIAMLHIRATTKYPELSKHKSGINSGVFECLLLAQRPDMQIAYELEQYFRTQDKGRKGPSLIDNGLIDESSFSVQYAQNNEHMIETRDQILHEDEQNVKTAQEKFNKCREEVEAWRNQANGMECGVDLRTNSHSRYCERCKLKKKADKARFEQYKHLLPEDEIKQFAIVFELEIPTAIACLRDVLCSFVVFCNGESKNKPAECIWTEELDEFENSTSEYVKLGSTESQSAKKIAIDASSTFNKFVVENLSNCVMFANRFPMPTAMNLKRIKKLCTLEATEEYSELQWCLNSTQHTENQVLASQSKCSTQLTLSEYKNYGSLRADGHRLQIRKLYAMIETEALSFEKEAVFALIMQTLWECGVCANEVSEDANGESDFIRESHIDFADVEFCDAMIVLLEDFVERQRTNWMHPFKLLTTTLIAVRAFEINDSEAVAEKIVKLLRKIRSIAIKWIDEIEKTTGQLANPDESTESSLRLKLIYIAILGGLTFFVHPNHEYFSMIFENNQSIQWVRFVVCLKNNVRMYTNDEKQLPSNLMMLLRLMESVGMSVHDKVKELIDQRELNKLIECLWPRSASANTFKELRAHPDMPHILMVVVELDSRDQTVTIDIITGTFLVNNLPPSRLPNQIIDSPLYRWFFGNVVLQVQPHAQRTFSAVRKYNGCTYEFKTINDQIIITEKMDDEFGKELIDSSVFNSEFPYTLIYKYTHWWNKADNCIEFRKKASKYIHFSKETTIDYRLNLETGHLIHEQTKRPMLYVNSKSYGKITRQLARLEHPKYIHIFYLADKEEAQVELLRMNLKFTVKFLGKLVPTHLTSNEFGGMIVCQSQYIGTLSGLNHGLFLKSVTDSDTAARQILLIPNGYISIKSNGAFASVDIDTKGELQSPPFYQYQVDTFCQQLKSSNGSHASWFFLAYLHAITSHGEIDTFTGMSGTERALQILQSSFVWSSSPYDEEAFKLLLKIAELTPIRKVENDIQRIEWPKHIPTCAAQDCFISIARKLLADSQQLHNLHGEFAKRRIDTATQTRYNERSHRQYQQLYPNLRVSNSMIASDLPITSPPNCAAAELSDNTRTVCILYHKKQFKIPSNPKILKKFLTERVDILLGVGDQEGITGILSHSIHVKLRDLWIELYDAVINRTINSKKLACILSFYAHCGEDIQPILALQAISANLNTFRHIVPPRQNLFYISDGSNCKINDIKNILKAHFSTEPSNNGIARNILLNTIADDIDSRWPCSSVDITNITSRCNFNDIDFAGANKAINEKVSIWYANHELDEFIKNIGIALTSLTTSGVSRLRVPTCDMTESDPKNWSQFSIDCDKKMHNITKTFTQDIQKARKIFKMETSDPPHSTQYWWTIYKNICKSNDVLHLVQAGLFPRMVPSFILPKLLDPQLDDDSRCLTGAYAMTIAHEQRKNRIEEYKRRPEMKAALEREEQNKPHENWKPCDYPEWLLFEIEQNLTIRRIQIEVAKRMIDPPHGETKHSVMQLNMGEGKTAVIVPILAARLADGTQGCQIVVLKPLFATNLKSLRQYLGGFLNRRIYVFPCRRDMPIEEHSLEMLSIYEECQREKGVILTLPEYLLSFQLKIYESISVQLKIDEKDDRNFGTTKNLLGMFKWMNSNMRTVLDESDAILQAMYQLVYTVGKQFHPDGDSQRWLVAQALLKRVPGHMKTLYDTFGNEKIEFGQSYGTHMDFDGRPDVFTPCRILDETVFDALRDLLIEDFLDGKIDLAFTGVDDAKKGSIKEILKCKELEKNTFKAIESYTLDKQNVVYILSGLLRFEILKLALTKRWRVNYGVDGNGKRKMAIPFKAKDIAAENTEFGHPDVAVCFTQMSYYYSGLTDDELYQVFHIMENLPDASNVYEKWMNGIPIGLRTHIPATYKGINLDDSEQRDNQLFPLLQHNIDVINFWLSNVVYPQELKIFEKKLMCTAWDLCSEHIQRPVTGFSGTNDTKNTLPLTITQNDLPELEHTNKQMREILLDAKNKVYQTPGIVNGKEVLKTLVERRIHVLLDSGALMLELNNKQVAIEWLKLAIDCSAAVYFDEQDTLQTIDRNNIVSEFGYSVHRENLSKCVVYLDDAHTRGTDLKFPMDWTACVTLSGDITRDKTVQSCMRMRQLATTQSILFWPSYEANVRLQALSRQGRVECKHVMEFIEENSQKFETSNMVHWTTAALNYTKKLVGHKLYEGNDLEALYDACVDGDFVKLKDMFGEKNETLLSEIAVDQFGKIYKHYMRKKASSILPFIKKMRDKVVEDKLCEIAPDVKKFTHSTDEQQEKELEQEIEEETQIQRPPDAKPADPKMDKNIALLVRDGVGATVDIMKANGTLVSIGASLSNRQMFEDFKNNADAWSDRLFVTKDFHTVIDSVSVDGNDFLRPVCWIARINHPNDRAKDILIILSSYECNNLLPTFRKSTNSTLFMYRPRLSHLHSNMIHETELQLTATSTSSNEIQVEDEVQINVFAGSMYFDNEAEQEAYCNFLGLVPKPWTRDQEKAHVRGLIDGNKFVCTDYRNNFLEEIVPGIQRCKFNDNPTDLAIKLVKAHHQFLPKDCHVASILNRGLKVNMGEVMDLE